VYVKTHKIKPLSTSESEDSTAQPKQSQKSALKKMKSTDRMKYQKSFGDDDEDNIVFEDFARLRLADE